MPTRSSHLLHDTVLLAVSILAICAVAPAIAQTTGARSIHAGEEAEGEEPRGLAIPSEDSWGDEWSEEGGGEQPPPTWLPAPASPPKDPFPAAATDQPPAEESPERISPPSQRFTDLELRWAERRLALQRRDAVGAAAQEVRLLELLRILDVRDVDTLSAVAVRESKRFLHSDPQLALARAELAASLSPSLPAAHLARLEARFAIDPWDLRGWAKAGLDACWAAMKSERHLRPILSDVGTAAALSLGLGGAVALLLFALRYGRYVLHDFHHLFPKRTAKVQTLVLAGLLLTLPWALGLGPIVFAAFVAAALWLYLGRAEQVVVACWLVLLGLLPLGVGWLAERVAWSGTDAETYDRIERTGDPTRLPALERRGFERSATAEELFVLARAKKREGAWPEAVELYERVLSLREGWGPATINLANLRFLQGDLEGAERLYREAIASDPSWAEAWFGLSRIHYRAVDFESGQRARETALRLDPNLVERYTSGEEDGVFHANHFLVDVRLEDSELIRATHAPGESKRLVEHLSRRLQPKTPIAVAPWWPMGLIAGLLVLGRSRIKIRPSTACIRCGRAVCGRCDLEAKVTKECGQCLHVFGNRGRVDPAARLRKELSVRRYRSRRRLVFRAGALLLWAPFLSGKALRGLLFVVVALFFLSLWAFDGGILRRTFESGPGLWRPLLYLPPLIVIYLTGVRAGWKEG